MNDQAFALGVGVANGSASPIGTSVEQHIRDREASSRTFRGARARLGDAEELARMVIMNRAGQSQTQEDLARRLGVSRRFVARIECGQSPVNKVMRRLLADARAVERSDGDVHG